MEAYEQCLMFFSPLEQMNGKRLMCQQTDKKCSHESVRGAGARCEGTKSSFQHEKTSTRMNSKEFSVFCWLYEQRTAGIFRESNL